MNINDFDLKAKAERGLTVTLMHPIEKGVELDAKVSIVGIDSKAYRQATAKMKRLDNATDEQKAKAGAKLLASITTGWEGIEEDGKELVFSFDNAVSLYLKYDWIADQILAKAYDRKAFFYNESAN